MPKSKKKNKGLRRKNNKIVKLSEKVINKLQEYYRLAITKQYNVDEIRKYGTQFFIDERDANRILVAVKRHQVA